MRKKLFAILMSAMMMVTFMPAMAFAAASHTNTPVDTGINFSAEFITQAQWDNLVKMAEKEINEITIVKAPTHLEKGKVILGCVLDYCDQSKEYEVPVIEHGTYHDYRDGAEVNLTIEEYAKAMAAQGTLPLGYSDPLDSEEEVAHYIATVGANFCYVEKARMCSCGYVWAAQSANSTQNIGKLVAHITNSTCKDITCVCGKTIKATATHSAPTDVTKGTRVAANCGKRAGYNVACTACGETFFVEDLTGNTADVPHNYGTAVADTEATAEDALHQAVVKAGYFAVKFTPGTADPTTVKKATEVVDLTDTAYKFYKATSETPGTCGGNTTYTLKCSVCGTTLLTDTVAVEHEYVTTTVTEATCAKAGVAKNVCKKCGHTYKSNITAKAHEYEAKHVAAEACQDEYYEIVCKNCGSVAATIDRATASTGKTNEGIDGSFDYTYTGVSGKSFLLHFSAKTAKDNHVYLKAELLKDATCTTNALWGYKCTVCGKIATGHDSTYKPFKMINTKLGHDYVETVLPATCENKAGKLVTCSRCDYVDAQPGAAIVGGKCDETVWTVTKAATIFEEGVKAISCSKCGNVKATAAKAVIAKLSYAAPKVSVKKGKVVVTVKAQADAVKYVVKAGKKTKTVDAAGKVTLKKVAKKGKKVKVTVTAYNAAGAKVVSKAKTVKAK